MNDEKMWQATNHPTGKLNQSTTGSHLIIWGK